MRTLAERIRLAMAESSASQTDLATACNVKPPSVNDWVSGKTKSLKASTGHRAASFLGVNFLWLTEGTGPMRNTTDSAPQTLALPLSRVPLISWVQAGDFAEAFDPHPAGHAEEWVDTTVPIRPHTFALRVQGDSMEPDFPEGMIIVIEPDLDPQPGDFVVAKNGDDATFKKLVKDGADWYLKPLNPRYPIKPLGESRLIGVVREAIRRFR